MAGKFDRQQIREGYCVSRRGRRARWFQAFFEPEDHLTNGSFDRAFAWIFSEVVTENTVLVLDARHLKNFFDKYERVLLKIDVDGYELSCCRL